MAPVRTGPSADTLSAVLSPANYEGMSDEGVLEGPPCSICTDSVALRQMVGELTAKVAYEWEFEERTGRQRDGAVRMGA